MDLLTVSSVRLLARLWECFGSHFQPKFSWDIHRKEMYFTIGFADNSSLAIKSDAVKEFLTGTKLDLARAKGKRRQY